MKTIHFAGEISEYHLDPSEYQCQCKPKKHDVYCKIDYSGEYVTASVARGLYEALRDIREYLMIGKWTNHVSPDEQSRAALDAADKEE